MSSADLPQSSPSCPECGKPVQPGMPGCPNCGHQLYVEHPAPFPRDATATDEEKWEQDV